MRKARVIRNSLSASPVVFDVIDFRIVDIVDALSTNFTGRIGLV
jgi:hypothetical protein